METSRIWLKISSDRYELPLAVADTARELAQMCGVTVGTIYSQMSCVKAGKRPSCPYICITV